MTSIIIGLKIMDNRQLVTKSTLVLFLTGVSLGLACREVIDYHRHSYDTIGYKLNVCFTPPSGCSNFIATEITKAQYNIHLQAYGLTSRLIINQLINAHNRGVIVKVILDGGNLSNNNKIALELKNAGIEVNIDRIASGIAHNKVIIIDDNKVITGSFNFTKSADTRNAENVLLIKDQEIAQIYLLNWHKRKAKSDLINNKRH